MEFSWGATEVKPPVLADAIVEGKAATAVESQAAAEGAESGEGGEAGKQRPKPRPTRSGYARSVKVVVVM